jgi:hypothetical protein
MSSLELKNFLMILIAFKALFALLMALLMVLTSLVMLVVTFDLIYSLQLHFPLPQNVLKKTPVSYSFLRADVNVYPGANHMLDCFTVKKYLLKELPRSLRYQFPLAK